MKKRTLALLLAGALALSLLGATVLAAEEETPSAQDSSTVADSSAGQEDEIVQTDTPEPEDIPDGSQASADGSGAPEPDEPEQTEGEGGNGEESAIPEYIPDPAGSISFQNMGPRMREGNLNVLALEENIQVIRAIDYDELREDIRTGLNQIANAQWALISMPSMGQLPTLDVDVTIPGSSGTSLNEMIGGINQMLSASMSMSTTSTAQSLQSQYDAMREVFDDLKSGKLQADNEDLIWQLTNAQNQIIMAGQSLYIAVVNMEQNGKTLDRSLATLDRTLTELELRYELGHISSQTLAQARAGRTSLLSSQQTLDSNIKNYKMQLELLIGAQLTGNIRLGALPRITDRELNAMDLETDLAAAKQASYSLYEAKQTLDDAEETFQDAGKEYNHNDKHYEYVQAQHQWQAAQHNYNATVQNFEMGLRSLYLQVQDNRQVLEAARSALSIEESNYAVAQLKHTQGNLSQSALLEAEDAVKQAQETVDSAAITLFSSYQSYRWAVDYGILN